MTSARPYIWAFILLLLATFGAIKAMGWVRAHPEHFHGQRFEIAHPIGWATRAKLTDLSMQDDACFAALDRADIAHDRRAVVGQGQCRASQRMVFGHNAAFPAMWPSGAAPSCGVSAALLLWQRDSVSIEAETLFGEKVVRIENLGSYNCRNVRGGSRPSQHSTANAIDISAFILADGTRISVKDHWADEGLKGAFLRAVRDGACDVFTTTLSPDYNAAHADHFHFDLARRPGNWSLCR